MARGSIVSAWPSDLRHSTGDVVVRFSRHSSETLLLNHSVLSQQSTYFKAFFSSPWRKPKLIRGPNGEEKEVWELDLFFDKELSIATLVGDACQTPRETTEANASAHSLRVQRSPRTPQKQFLWTHAQPKDFRHHGGDSEWIKCAVVDQVLMASYCEIIPRRGSDYEGWDWPRYTHREVVNHSRLLHKVLFTFVHGQDPVFNTEGDMVSIGVFFANLIRLADFYDLLDSCASTIEKHLLSLEDLWADIAKQPEFYLVLGAHLRSKCIMRDAMKHGIGRNCFSRWFFDQYQHLLPPDLWDLNTLGREQLGIAIANLNDSIGEVIHREMQHQESRFGSMHDRVELQQPTSMIPYFIVSQTVTTTILRNSQTRIDNVECLAEPPCGALGARNYHRIHRSAVCGDFEMLRPGFLSSFASTAGMDETQLRDSAGRILQMFKQCFANSALFSNCGGHSSLEPCPYSHSYFQNHYEAEFTDRQKRAEHEFDDHFTFLDLHYTHWLAFRPELEGSLFNYFDTNGNIVDEHGWPVEESESDVGDSSAETWAEAERSDEIVEEEEGEEEEAGGEEFSNADNMEQQSPPESSQPPAFNIYYPAPPELLQLLGIETRAQRAGRELSTNDTDTFLDGLADLFDLDNNSPPSQQSHNQNPGWGFRLLG